MITKSINEGIYFKNVLKNIEKSKNDLPSYINTFIRDFKWINTFAFHRDNDLPANINTMYMKMVYYIQHIYLKLNYV